MIRGLSLLVLEVYILGGQRLAPPIHTRNLILIHLLTATADFCSYQQNDVLII